MPDPSQWDSPIPIRRLVVVYGSIGTRSFSMTVMLWLSMEKM